MVGSVSPSEDLIDFANLLTIHHSICYVFILVVYSLFAILQLTAIYIDLHLYLYLSRMHFAIIFRIRIVVSTVHFLVGTVALVSVHSASVLGVWQILSFDRPSRC